MKQNPVILKITSDKDPLIRKVIALKTPQERATYGEYVAEGERVCETICTTQYASQWFVTESMLSVVRAFKSQAHVYVVSDKIMNRISSSTTPSGILGVFPIPEPQLIQAPGVVFDALSDPGNVGTLIRSAVAFGFRTVISIKGGVDIWNSKVVQASAGAIAQINISQMSWENFLKLKNPSQKLVALSAHASEAIHPQLIADSFLLLGNEAHGVGPEHEARADCRVYIPMSEKIESLNVAVAGSIALFLATQHRA